jgi:urease accessory protein
MTTPLRLLSQVPESERPGSEGELLRAPALLRLLQLTSPALPVGAFAFSQGLETAVEMGLVTDEAGSESFLHGVLSEGLGRLDLPVLARLHAAWSTDDQPAVERWTHFLLASRETHERLLEDGQLGRALARLLADQGISGAASWVEREDVTHATVFALAAGRFGVPVGPALLGFAFSWAENQVGALARLVPLGQLAAQRVLTSLAAVIPSIVESARLLPDNALGATLPGLAIASALHETQYTRLFKS